MPEPKVRTIKIEQTKPEKGAAPGPQTIDVAPDRSEG
jgi:hypothetical protein